MESLGKKQTEENVGPKEELQNNINNYMNQTEVILYLRELE